jgi:outer membrane lipopolysaccharide assembly protein LptE/RlpB
MSLALCCFRWFSPCLRVRGPRRTRFWRAGVGVSVVVLLIALTGCGYHIAGQANRMPPDMHVLAVPVFTNQTQTYALEQLLTRQVVREFVNRTKYRVEVKQDPSADATLNGIIVSAQSQPLTYDPQSGRISSSEVTVTMKVTLTDRTGRVLFENPNYVFRQQYQISQQVNSFFKEETPALMRMSQDFARTLVSDVLEGF